MFQKPALVMLTCEKWKFRCNPICSHVGQRDPCGQIVIRDKLKNNAPPDTSTMGGGVGVGALQGARGLRGTGFSRGGGAADSEGVRQDEIMWKQEKAYKCWRRLEKDGIKKIFTRSNVDPGSELFPFRIQGQKDSRSRIRICIKEFKYFNPKNLI